MVVSIHGMKIIEWDVDLSKISAEEYNDIIGDTLIKPYNLVKFSDRGYPCCPIFRVEYFPERIRLPYSSYGFFRREICERLHGIDPKEIWHNPEQYEDYVFYELIHFADNEGHFRKEIIQKLYQDWVGNSDLFTKEDIYYLEWIDLGKLLSKSDIITYG